ncbi:hypothetical protein AWENTII_009421 [Aspergillus wentii]|nr:hypothetical protein MW887_001135 [Aspergillus wentii]
MPVPIPMLGSGPYGTSKAARATKTVAAKDITTVVKEVNVSQENVTNTASPTWKEKISRQYKKFYRRD